MRFCQWPFPPSSHVNLMMSFHSGWRAMTFNLLRVFVPLSRNPGTSWRHCLQQTSLRKVLWMLLIEYACWHQVPTSLEPCSMLFPNLPWNYGSMTICLGLLSGITLALCCVAPINDHIVGRRWMLWGRHGFDWWWSEGRVHRHTAMKDIMHFALTLQVFQQTSAIRAAPQSCQVTGWRFVGTLGFWKVSGMGHHVCRHICPSYMSLAVQAVNLLQLLRSLLVFWGHSYWFLWKNWGGSLGNRLERRRRLHTLSNAIPLLTSKSMQFPSWKAWAVSVVFELFSVFVLFMISFAFIVFITCVVLSTKSRLLLMTYRYIGI